MPRNSRSLRSLANAVQLSKYQSLKGRYEKMKAINLGLRKDLRKSVTLLEKMNRAIEQLKTLKDLAA
eukprot:4639934-Pyramimonas_sp.AAC.1